MYDCINDGVYKSVGDCNCVIDDRGILSKNSIDCDDSVSNNQSVIEIDSIFGVWVGIRNDNTAVEWFGAIDRKLAGDNYGS